ncbi:MAG: hypothetical protein KatS3mg042_0813 [Rhodothermaceae bacterium]|nr:MAG: hypothetical protein KatS3mg042_0813 [Rhodothermaceae bacterium]
MTTQEEYLLALKNLARARQRNVPEAVADAEKLLEAARQRLVYWAVPEEEIAHLEQTGEVRRTLRLDAPATGVVIDRNALEGTYVRAGQDLFRIADLRSVWVHASFYENEVPWIREGQPVTMELSYLPGKTYTGHVSYIYPYLREKARDVHVRLIFANPDLDLKPGMYANVTLQGRTIPNALVVPTEAVIRSGERSLVFVARGEGRFEPREVRLGAEGGPGNRYVHILSGLLEGEDVVVSAQFLLDSESRLQEAIQKMLSARQAPPPAEAPANLPPAAPGDTMDHDTMDHDTMDHGTMDHGTMDHDATDHDATDHGTMDHGTTDHSQMDHGQMDHARPDTTMNHDAMDHARPDTTMNHGPGHHAPRPDIR